MSREGQDRPVALDIIGTDSGFEDSLRIAARRHGLDAEALVAAAQAALAAPDRQVTLDVDARSRLASRREHIRPL